MVATMMSANLDALALSEEPASGETASIDGVVAPAVNAATSTDVVTASLFSSWPAALPASASRVRELSAVIALSAFLHASLAAAAFRVEHAPRAAKRVSRVEIELARPPRPEVKPAVVPPPPPKPTKQEVARPREVVEKPPAPAPVELPVDTGSSLPAAEDGELQAGSGGLGIAAPSPSPSVPTPPAPEPIVQAREGANYQNNPRPNYPRIAKHEHWEGTTMLRVLVDPSGRPATTKVAKSSGHDLLDEAATEAVMSWTFVPATQGGKAVAGFVMVPIIFRLQ
jgi:periplasmic protein TonB